MAGGRHRPSLSTHNPTQQDGGAKGQGTTTQTKKKKKATSADGQRVQVLHEVDGYVERGEMLAIIGASSRPVMHNDRTLRPRRDRS